MFPDTIQTSGEGEGKIARVSLTRPVETRPRYRPVEEIAAELAAMRAYADGVEAVTIPAAEQRLADAEAARGAALAQHGQLKEHVWALMAAEQERQRQAGAPAIQTGWVVPTGTAASFGVTPIERGLMQVEAFEQRELAAANALVSQREKDLAWLRGPHLGGDVRPRIGDLERELEQATAAQEGAQSRASVAEVEPWGRAVGQWSRLMGLPAPTSPTSPALPAPADGERPSGSLARLQGRLGGMGLTARPEGKR